MKSFINLLILFSTIFFNANLSQAAQHDYVISNDTGANVRADINSALLAGQSQNSGTTAPATMYAYQLWMDSSGGTPILKMRNAENSAWIIIGDGSLVGLGLLDRTGGTVSGELLLTATNDVKIPVGTTAQRNGSPVNGQLRYNSDLKNYEGYHESQFSQFQREVANADYISNVSLSASVGSNALTISLKTAAGANAAAGDPAIIAFRSATLASGDVSLVKVTGALSTVISSGSTAGHTNAVEWPLYIYAINNAGTTELAWSSRYYDENVLFTTTAEGGTGTADSAVLIYSSTARTSVAGRLIGRLLSTQITAGTWAAVPTNIQVGSAGKIKTSDSIVVLARAYKNTAQSLANSAFTEITNYTGTTVDNYSGFNLTTGRYTVPVAGTYEVISTVFYDSNSTGMRGGEIWKNGAAHVYSGIVGAGNGDGTTSVGTLIDTFKVGDTISNSGYQTSGGALNVRALSGATNLSIKRLGN